MANTFNTGVYKEEWMTKLQERLDRPTSWKDVADVLYSDVNIFNVPYMSTEFSVQTGTRGTAYGFSDFALTNETISLTTKRLVPVFIDRADLAQCQYTTQMELAERQGALIDEHLETGMLDDHANWTDVGLSGADIASGATAQITVTSSNVADIVRAVRRIVTVGNGLELAQRNGLFIVWRAADFEALEAYAQQNGFNIADAALKNGVNNGFYFLGCYHYVSNNHTANHLFAGVRKLFKIGILRETYGQLVITQDPNLQSGIGMISRLDYGTLTPTAHVGLLLDINVA